MKASESSFHRGNWIPSLITLWFAFIWPVAFAQTPSTVYCIVTFQKVTSENVAEYEKIITENWKPLHQLRKQNGKILNWALYKIHYKGANDAYNYVSVTYYDSFIKTEPNDNFPELMKAANPKADAQAIFTKTRSLRTIVSQAMYNRVETITSKTPAPIKYIVVSFQKSKPGLHNEALKIEREEWKPIHQVMTDGGQMITWNVWTLVIPSGAEVNHDYFTSNIFSSYDQVATQGYADAFKKLGKDAQPVLDRTAKTKDMTKRELLEFVVGL